MKTFWELLFRAWVPSYHEDMAPEHLKDDPVQAYGQYAFQSGVIFGLSLAVSLFQRWDENS